ncbi:hypothetical protein [Streptomyces fulvoviolaceus]|uniref:hypothetical protein n=1 Tax=Streptomyces fulvoviolaceus TaxID=285535 RepID=UPI0004CBF577|nr:hypothetical protein [Streptomyces fulvoviolaceus]
MLQNEYLIDIFKERERLGSALRLTRKFALTATHCLGGHMPTEQDHSRLSLTDGTPVVVPLYNKTSDLALLRLVLGDDDALPPRVSFGKARRGESWTATYRFPAQEKPPTGSVVDPDALYRRTSDLVAKALRLSCELRKDHAPFAGSPVERGAGAVPPVALGVIVEPQDRIWAESDEIFAGSVVEALDLFSITRLRLLADGHAEAGFLGDVESIIVGERDAERQTGNGSKVDKFLDDEGLNDYVQMEWTR